MNDDIVIEALNAATTKAEVKAVLDLHGRDAFRRAWDLLDPVVRGSLLLTRSFDGEVIPDTDLDDIF